MKISGFVAYVKQLWKNKPDVSTPLSAERLTHMEDGIKMTSDAIEAIAAAVVSQITNDPDKIASMAALYAVNQQVTQLNSDKVNRTSVDVQRYAYFLHELTIGDVLDLSLDAGIYRANSDTLNIPIKSYAMVLIFKDSIGTWEFVVFIPTSLMEIYINFHNGYSTPDVWEGWKKFSLTSL